MSSLALFFRIVYRTFYALFHVLLIALLLVSPSDIINQARLRSNLYPILIVSICYVLSILFVVFVYFTRLYVTQSVLKSIPKSWIPIEKGDVGKNIRKMIVAGLSRSAAIAFASRPHAAPPPSLLPPGSSSVENNQQPGQKEEEEQHDEPRRKSFQLLGLKKAGTVEEEMGISLPPLKPVWGDIEHFGWASPESLDLPNLQYSTVISELPNLIEAKALTLAPPAPASPTDPPMLDPDAVGLLQRPPSMGLRDYLAHLTELGVLAPSPALITDFVAMYEHARFSTRMISNLRFRELMHHFAEILRGMKPLDPAILHDDGDDDLATSSDSDIDNDAPMGTNPTTPRSQRSQAHSGQGGGGGGGGGGSSARSPASLRSSNSSSSSSGAGSQVRRRPRLPARNSSANTWQQYRTAPTTPKSRRTAVSRSSLSLSRSSSASANSFAQTRQPYPVSQPSSSSLRTASSAGSVIRLAERRDPTELPYVLSLPGTA